MEGCNNISPELSLLQAKQPEFSQPFFLAEVLQPSEHFCVPPLDPLYTGPCLSCTGKPRAGGLMRAEQRARIPSLNLLAMLLSMQLWITGFLGCKCTWLILPVSPSCPLQCCSQPIHHPACTGTRDCPYPGADLLCSEFSFFSCSVLFSLQVHQIQSWLINCKQCWMHSHILGAWVWLLLREAEHESYFLPLKINLLHTEQHLKDCSSLRQLKNLAFSSSTVPVYFFQ